MGSIAFFKAYDPLFLPFRLNGFSSQFTNFFSPVLLGFFLLLGLFAKVCINIQLPKHMKCYCDSYANKKRLFFFSVFSSSFLFLCGLFRTIVPALFFFSCLEQCCLFEFPNLAIILKHSFHFINSVPYPMDDLLRPFVSALMSLVLKQIPFTSLTQNTLLLSLSSSCLLPQTLSPIPYVVFHVSFQVQFLLV